MNIKRLSVLLLALVMLMGLAPAAMAAKDPGTLRMGDTDWDFDVGLPVTEAQQRLAYYGYYTGTIDGTFTAEMRAAVIQFQQRNNLKADGVIGSATWALLRSDNAIHASDPGSDVLKLGDRGDRVTQLQIMLKTELYYVGDIDGYFDGDVQSAVISFQQSAGLKADGKVGKITWTALSGRTPAIFHGGRPVRTLRGGMRGYDVYVLQLRLQELGYLSMIPTKGYYGNATADAVKAFQKANKLTQTGNVTYNLTLYLWPTGDGGATLKLGDRILKQGMSGHDVSDLQMHMKGGGFFISKVDGVYGPKTRDAVKKVQKAYGLKEDGIAGKETIAIIITFPLDETEPEPDPGSGDGALKGTLSKGDRGTRVKAMQERLILAGYLATGEDDGVFGSRTRAAVRLFQRAYSLKVDGIAGEETLGMLYRVTDPLVF